MILPDEPTKMYRDDVKSELLRGDIPSAYRIFCSSGKQEPSFTENDVRGLYIRLVKECVRDKKTEDDGRWEAKLLKEMTQKTRICDFEKMLDAAKNAIRTGKYTAEDKNK